MNTEYKEIEVRFLEVEVPKLVARLQKLGAKDNGAEVLREIIFYDPEFRWLKERKRVRLRAANQGTFLTYKHFEKLAATGTTEIELKVSDIVAARDFLIAIGLVAAREQEKKRHTFTFQGVTVDIDTWPGVPSYVELEGTSEADLRRAADALGLDWSQVELRDPLMVLEQHYKLPVSRYKFFTFNRVE